MKTILYILMSMNLFSSCQKAESRTDTPVVQTEAATKMNVAYGPDSAQRMDVYLPAGRTAASTPSIVLIHGGGWNSGSRREFASYIDSFRRRMPEYAIFNLDYRLVSGQHLFPTQEQDVRKALEFIAEHASGYGVSTDRVVLLGASAGAHLALLQAYKYTEPVKVRAVIDFFGPTDLMQMYRRPWHPMIPYLLQTLTGTSPEQDPAIYNESSPAYFVTKDAPPTLILHGESDPIVDVAQSRLLSNKLKAAGVRHELVVYPRERHGWHGTTLTNSFDRIEKFLKSEHF